MRDQPRFDHWQAWHVLGDPSNHTLLNVNGQALAASLLGTVAHSKSPHGVFVDSCSHHCTSCSSKADDVWNGENVRHRVGDGDRAGDSVGLGITPAVALKRWYTSKPQSKTHIYLQSGRYPCLDCCKCRSWVQIQVAVTLLLHTNSLHLSVWHSVTCRLRHVKWRPSWVHLESWDGHTSFGAFKLFLVWV